MRLLLTQQRERGTTHLYHLTTAFRQRLQQILMIKTFMMFLNQFSKEMLSLPRRSQYPLLEMRLCPLIWFINSISIGISLSHGENSHNSMSMIQEKLKIDTKDVIWKRKTSVLETNTPKKNVPVLLS